MVPARRLERQAIWGKVMSAKHKHWISDISLEVYETEDVGEGSAWQASGIIENGCDHGNCGKPFEHYDGEFKTAEDAIDALLKWAGEVRDQMRCQTK